MNHRIRLDRTAKGLREALGQAGAVIAIRKQLHLASLANLGWEDLLSQSVYKMGPIRKIARLGAVE